MTYQEEIVETLSRTVTVRAESAEDAERLVWDDIARARLSSVAMTASSGA